MITRWLGLIDYNSALELQEEAYLEVKSTGIPVILGCEHPEVVTLGKRSIRDSEILTNCRFPIVQTDRGGQATLHNPDQLVIYPIVDIRRLGLGARSYVNLLLTVGQEILNSQGVTSKINDVDMGIYTSQGKIGSVGIRIDRGITRHGIAINVSNNIDDFAFIRTCGFQNRAMDKVENWGKVLSTKLLFNYFCDSFMGQIGRRTDLGDLNL